MSHQMKTRAAEEGRRKYCIVTVLDSSIRIRIRIHCITISFE